MITNELIEYINGELNDNVSKDLIISTLLEAGWHKEDIEEAFSSIKTKENNEVKKSFDPYRELPEEGDPASLRLKAELEDKNTGTIMPTGGAQILDLSNLNKQINVPIIDTTIVSKPVEKIVEEPVAPAPAVKEPVVEVTPPDLPIAPLTTPIIIPVQEKPVAPPVVETPIVEVAPLVEAPIAFTMPPIVIPPHEEKIDVNKVWTPTTIKPVEENKPALPHDSSEAGEKGMEVFNLEISDNKEQKPIPPKEEVKKPETIITEPLIVVTPEEIKKENDEAELIPNLNKIPSIASMGGVISKPDNTISTKIENNKSGMSDMVPNKAMLSSFSQAIVSATQKEEEIIAAPLKNKKKSILKLGILILVLAIIGGMVFAFVEGYIKIPGSKFSFLVVKKDPKTLILNTPSSIAKLKSFKTETNINISSPSLSNITTGLSSGDVVTSKDKDSISIKALGVINNNTNGKSIIDYTFDVKSSILENDIKTNLKYNNGELYVSVPDLTPVLGKDAPDPTTILTKRDQLDLVVKELPGNVQDLIKKLDIYNIISTEVPLYVKNETAFMTSEFVNTFEYVDKGEEQIHGVDTSHYEITVTRPATKKFLSSLANLFVPQLPAEEKTTLDEAIGATSISSFEVWVGKNDDNLYQIKFTLNAPLSKILRLNDSGIAGNEVKLDVMTTFYDLDVPNNISVPKADVNMDGFIKNIQNIKIKNTVLEFKPQTTLFKNAVGSFGKTNTLGSCAAPISGSMFSPLGHSKGADTAVSSISTVMNSLLSITKNEGSCYSTNKAWALAVPLKTDPISYYCIDSAGTITTLLYPITGAVCTSSAPVVETTKDVPALPTTPPVTN